MIWAGLILIALGFLGWSLGHRAVGGLTAPQGRTLLLILGAAGSVLVFVSVVVGTVLRWL